MDLDAAFIIRAGSSILYLLLGLAILVVGRRNRGAVALGTLLAAVGGATLWSNLGDGTTYHGLRDVLLYGPLDFAVGFSAIALAVLMPARLQRRERWTLVFGMVLALAQLVRYLDTEGGWSGRVTRLADIGVPRPWAPFLVAGDVVYLVGLYAWVLTASARLAISTPKDRAEWVRWMALIFLMAPYMVLLFSPTPGNAGDVWGFVAFLVLVVGLTIPWVVAGARARRFHVPIALLWPALGLAFVLYRVMPATVADPRNDPWGLYGIIRILAWSFLVYAILRADLLRVKLPRIAVSGGVVAAGSLAVLFIVAQVAQNFFSSEYGLLTGGVIAGTFLFAASPIQKRIERVSERNKTTTHALVAPSGGAKQEAAFREAVQLALRDRRMTRQEEVHLFHVAEALGISAGRAMELRHEVEAAKGVR